MDQPRVRRCKGLPLWLRARIWVANWTRRDKRYYHTQVRFLPRRRITKMYAYPNELDAMLFVRAHTTIPVPRVHRAYRIENPGDEVDGMLFIVMDEMPGKPLNRVIKNWTPAQADVFAQDLADVFAQLRRLRPPPETVAGTGTETVVGAVRGGANRDGRLSLHPFGPFGSVADFHTYLRRGRPLAHWSDRAAVVAVHERPEGAYAVRFAHADLVPKNIMVDADSGHIAGVVDWEFAGWYPEYWEYTKAYYTEIRPTYDLFYGAVDAAVGGAGTYRDELACEQVFWMRYTTWEYCDPPWQPGDDGEGEGEGEEEEPGRDGDGGRTDGDGGGTDGRQTEDGTGTGDGTAAQIPPMADETRC